MTSCMWRSNKTVAVLSRILNNCVVQEVVVIIIVVLAKYEKWHKSDEDNKESITETKTHIFSYLVYN